jgi:hypothetical protein
MREEEVLGVISGSTSKKEKELAGAKR